MFSRSMSSGFPSTLLDTYLSCKARSRLKTSEVKNASSSKPHWLRAEGGFTDRRARRPSSESRHRLYGPRFKSSGSPKADSSSAKKLLAGPIRQDRVAQNRENRENRETHRTEFVIPAADLLFNQHLLSGAWRAVVYAVRSTLAVRWPF